MTRLTSYLNFEGSTFPILKRNPVDWIALFVELSERGWLPMAGVPQHLKTVILVS